MRELSEDDKELIRTYVADASTEEEKKLRRRECVEMYGVSIATVSAITAWTTIRANRKTTSVETKPVEVVESYEETGAHVNYDNPTKQLWRERWKTFLEKHTFPSEREKMKVLCLPGKKCLEIPLYLDLGFKAENILGVEGGDANARQEFSESAEKFGIRTKLGRLENLIDKLDDVYDVVSYDFTGPLCKKYLDIIKATPLAPHPASSCNTKSFFMLNLMGKRETLEGQCIIDFYASVSRPEFVEIYKQELNADNLRFVVDRTNELMERAKAGELTYQEVELKDKRDFSLIYMLNSLLGKDYRSNRSLWSGYIVDKLPKRVVDNFNFGKYTNDIIISLLEYLKFGIPKYILDTLFIGIPQIIDAVNTYRPFIYDVEEYRYSSPVNNASSPFLSEMLYLHTPMSDYVKARYVVRFFLDVLIWCAKHPDLVDELCVGVRDKNGKKLPRKETLKPKDTIELTDSDGFVVAVIQYQRIAQAINDMVTHIRKDKHLQQQIERIELN